MESTPEKLGLIEKYFSDFTPKQTAQFAGLEELYKDWNSKINVVSRKDIESIYLHHVLHSLSIAAMANFEPCLLYTSPSPRDRQKSRMPSSA